MNKFIKDNGRLKLLPKERYINIDRDYYGCIYCIDYDDLNYICYRYRSPCNDIYDFIDDIENTYFYIDDVLEKDLYLRKKSEFNYEIILERHRRSHIKIQKSGIVGKFNFSINLTRNYTKINI